jgi:hypothetical protein
VDANNEPILIQAPILQIGPGLAIDARELIRATTIELKTSTDIAAGRNIMTENWINSFITNVVVNPYIPRIATTNGDTSWCLMANSGQGPAAIEMGYLRGMTEPVLTTKASDIQVLGGGSVPVNFGDFQGNNVEYKGWLVIGGKVRDAKLGFMSNGTGS